MTMGADLYDRKHLPKANNAPAAGVAKVTIRRNVLAEIGAERAHVLDAFAGDGHLYREVWHEAAGYIGCDLQFYRDARLAYVVNNLRLLRTLDLAHFNVFDFDAYGSPWEQVYVFASRRKLAPGETIGLVLTEGQGLKLKMGGTSVAFAKLAGLRHRPGNRKGRTTAGLAGAHEDNINRALRTTTQMLGGEIVRRWESVGRLGTAMRYIGLVLRGA